MDGTMLIFAALLGFTTGVLFGASLVDAGWTADIVGRGLGLYCPTTGEFAFVGECVK
jgi:hypothetical protein